MQQGLAQPKPWKLLLSAEALFLCCIVFWVQSDLWYDEVLSLEMVFGHDSPWELFRDYRFANNHFLSNFLEWLWLRGLGVNSASEVLVRIPAVIFGTGTVAVAALYWKKFLSERSGWLAALLMAASPVFTAFAWQFRGYSLAIFLSALAVYFCAIRSHKSTVLNGFILFIIGLLLPMTMPSAAMLPCALALALFCQSTISGKSGWLRGLRVSFPPVAGAFLGTAYYLTILEQFSAATRESGGWTSAWLVGLHLLLAFALHLGALCVPVLQGVHLPHARGNLRCSAATGHPAESAPGVELAWWLFGACACAVVAILLLPSPVHRSPFPRVFLPLLPAVTFAAALLASDWRWLNDLPTRQFWKFLACMVICALLIRVGSDFLTDWELSTASEPPQNLLQQYYRGNGGVSTLLQEYKRTPDPQLKCQLVLVSPFILPTAWHYWQLYGLPESDLRTADSKELSHLLPANLVPPGTLKRYQLKGFEFLILARHEQEASAWADACGFVNPKLAPEGEVCDHHQFFRVLQP